MIVMLLETLCLMMGYKLKIFHFKGICQALNFLAQITPISVVIGVSNAKKSWGLTNSFKLKYFKMTSLLANCQLLRIPTNIWQFRPVKFYLWFEFVVYMLFLSNLKSSL
jgi:hypothetical protein